MIEASTWLFLGNANIYQASLILDTQNLFSHIFIVLIIWLFTSMREYRSVLESWVSGWNQHIANVPVEKLTRGFESLTLRLVHDGFEQYLHHVNNNTILLVYF